MVPPPRQPGRPPPQEELTTMATDAMSRISGGDSAPGPSALKALA
ncbi:SAM-dependent methyltransferase, partial [Streptomyces sp. WAC05858]